LIPFVKEFFQTHWITFPIIYDNIQRRNKLKLHKYSIGAVHLPFGNKTIPPGISRTYRL